MDEVKGPETKVDASEQKNIEPQEKAGEKDVSKLQDTKNTPENITKDISLEDDIESEKVTGGSYKDVFKDVENHQETEVHHMPADSINGLERNDGPAIAMDKADHRETASFGASKEAAEYRAAQKELIGNGDFKGAFDMDVKDIQEKFGDKYDGAIADARNYLNNLKTEGKI